MMMMTGMATTRATTVTSNNTKVRRTTNYFGASDSGVDKSGKYPPAPITKATIEPLTAKITRSESVTTRNFI